MYIKSDNSKNDESAVDRESYKEGYRRIFGKHKSQKGGRWVLHPETGKMVVASEYRQKRVHVPYVKVRDKNCYFDHEFIDKETMTKTTETLGGWRNCGVVPR